MTTFQSFSRLLLIATLALAGFGLAVAAEKAGTANKPQAANKPAAKAAKKKPSQAGSKLADAARKQASPGKTVITATPVEGLKIAKGFRVELLHTVPKETEGSWVCMCVDPRGRLIVCDQKGGLFRVTVPPTTAAGAKAKPLTIERIDVAIGEA